MGVVNTVPQEAEGIRRTDRGVSRLAALLVSCLTLALVFWGVLQFDLPLARFLRSFNHEWLNRLGEAGNGLGSGWTLAAVSLALLAAGWRSQRPAFRQAGLDGLIAHGAVALLVQTLKHLIGRPRPRMTHGSTFQFGPTCNSGLDSFPSGHTAAAFAVAVVLARHFPRAAWLFYGAAGMVAVSRVVRGSHFPTDVVAGVCLGVIVGALVAGRLRAWRLSLGHVLIQVMPYLVGSLALLWIAVHARQDVRMDQLMAGAGMATIGIGMAGRLSRKMHSGTANAAIAIGLALTTGSWFITMLVALTILARRLWRRAEDPAESVAAEGRMSRSVLAETALAIGLLLVVVLLQGLKGILPIM